MVAILTLQLGPGCASESAYCPAKQAVHTDAPCPFSGMLKRPGAQGPHVVAPKVLVLYPAAQSNACTSPGTLE